MKNQYENFKHAGVLFKAWKGVAIVLLLSLATAALSETIITSGSKLIVASGTKLVTAGTLVIKDGGTLNNSGTVIFKQNLTNETPGENDLGSGLAEFSGIANQTITGVNHIQDLRIYNGAGVTLAGPTLVKGTLILDNGKVDLGSNDLRLGPLGVIGGTPSVLAMVIATGSGMLQKEFPVGYTGSFTFAVGDNTDTPEYSPATLIFSVANSVVNEIGITLVNARFDDPAINGNYLKRYWMFDWYGTAVNCDATFQYTAADVVGDESVLSCTRIGSPTWITYGLTNPVSHLLSATGLTSLSWYTGVRSNTAPVDNQVQNVTLENGMTSCYSAINHLTVAGGGKIFLVKNGASATLVAGGSVTLGYGTTVQPGGYLHAYITTNGNYCGAVPGMVATTAGENEQQGIEFSANGRWVRIYPNPTSDKVIVELEPNGMPSGASVSIYNMQGERLMTRSFGSGSKFEFSLNGKPVGCYLFHVVSGGKSEIAKVIKE